MKFIAVGAVVGILVETILALFSPNLLYLGLNFNKTFNQRSGYPSDFYSVTGGSVYNSLPTIILFFGLIGGVIGFVVFKLRYLLCYNLLVKIKEIFKITSIPIFLASLCCLAPIVLVFLGVSTVAFGASLANLLDGKYKVLFLGVGIISLIISLIYYFRRRGICTLDQAKKHRNEIINKTLIVIIATVIGYVLFFNIFLGLVGTALHLWQGISFNP